MSEDSNRATHFIDVTLYLLFKLSGFQSQFNTT